MMKRKILSRNRMNAEARRLKAAGKTIVFTNGCFDILHLGHIRYLREARALGDVLVVGVNSDDSVRRLKGAGRPLVPGADRAEMLAALEAVDYVTLFGEDTPAALVAEIVPDIIVKGGDYRPGDVAGGKTVEAAGGRVVIVPLIEGRSTTGLIARAARLKSSAGKTDR
jgi:D-beta-D-heptose 7-phosphate kinase/D-beta-D-heptose 1-phosphate adenosyltransferase